jgi:hypothetical protein
MPLSSKRFDSDRRPHQMPAAEGNSKADRVSREFIGSRFKRGDNETDPMNKALNRRVCRLEALIRPANQTEFSRQMLARLESGCRRVAEMRERDGLLPIECWAPDGLGRPPTITEILHRGRARNVFGHQPLIEACAEPSSGIIP